MERLSDNNLEPDIQNAGLNVQEEVQEEEIDYEAILAEVRDASNDLEDEEVSSGITEEDFDELEKGEYVYYKKFDLDENGKAIRTFGIALPENKDEAKYAANRAYVAKHAALKRQFALEALAQKDINLDDVIPDYHLQMLVEILTQSIRDLIEDNKTWVNKYIGHILIARMPRCIKNTFYYHPQSIRRCPGFLYQASEDIGHSATMWVTPNIPYWYRQGTEMDILLERYGHCLPYIDKHVYRIKVWTEKLVHRQVHYAAKVLTMLPQGTYMNLVERNAVWFHRLYLAIMEQRKQQSDANKVIQSSNL